MVRAASRVFFAVWFLAFAGPAVFAGNRVALVIGNSDYALAPLENPKNDAASADWDHGDASNVLDQPGANAWPIAAATFIVMQKKPNDPAAAREALRFFPFALAKGDTMADELDYVPLPENAKKWAESRWSDIKGGGGAPLYSAPR